MEINALKPNSQPATYAAPKRSDVSKEAIPHSSNVEYDSVTQNQRVDELPKAEQQRLDTVVKAAHSFRNAYAVSDLKFTIFKDASGQFITRFTSLKDGSVKYVPEPDILQFMENASDRRAVLVEVQA
jgi:hypothetical protein